NQETRKRLFEKAREMFGRWRQELRQENATFDWSLCSLVFDPLCFFSTSSWLAIKPILLIFRELRHAAVNKDLRYWDETGKEPPPEPWRRIPRLLSYLFSAESLRKDSSGQPDLLDLRDAFALFCLERL